MADASQRRREVALFRYSLVRPLGDPELSVRARGELVRETTEREHLGPDGRWVSVSAPTLRRWLRAWRSGGFEALHPLERNQPTRTSAAVLEAAVTLKKEAPRRTAAQVARALEEAGIGTVSPRTLQRHFARLGLPRSEATGAPRVFGRFEAGDFGELWTGDGLHGPRLGGRACVLCAFIDDWSRAVPGWRWGFAEDTVRLEAALRRGLEVHGVPDRCFVDNGSAFTSAPFNRTLAVLGIGLVHSRPRQPASRGKIERFFRTVRTQFLIELDARGGVASLAELSELFSGWLEGVYHRRVHSETKETPQARLLRGRLLRRPSPAELHEAFLWSATRTVHRRTATVSLFSNHYEVDPALCGARIELVFDPFDLSAIEVRYEGRPMGQAVPRQIRRHVHPAARPDEAPAPVRSGIDYLGIVAARVAGEQAARIAYVSMAKADDASAGELDDEHEEDDEGEHEEDQG